MSLQPPFKIGKRLTACEVEADRKTRVWNIYNATDRIGYVQWHSPWRRYCFYPVGTVLFDAECLRDIAEHLELATAGHKGELGHG